MKKSPFRVSLIAYVLVAFAGFSGILHAQGKEDASSVYSKASGSVVMLLTESGKGNRIQGTGFLVEGGKIVTNAHVVSGKSVLIDLGLVKVPATIEKIDEQNDLALLIPSMPLDAKSLKLSNQLPEPGSSVYAIGNPQGLEKTISSGIVSAVRIVEGRQMIQVTSPLSHGSSGGPILNQEGVVVGVAVSIMENGQNLNFAVPSTILLKFIQSNSAGDARSGSDLITSISDALLAKILREMKIKFETKTTEGVTFFVVSNGDNNNFNMLSFGTGVLLKDFFTDVVEMEAVNNWNQNTVMGKAYIDKDRNPNIEDYLYVGDGVSEQVVKNFISRFPALIGKFATALISYRTEKNKAKPAVNAARQTRSASASMKLDAPRGEFAVWIDPTLWSITEKNQKLGRIDFKHVSNSLFAALISEPVTIPFDELAKSAIKNFREKDPKAEIEEREMRYINGRKMLMMIASATYEGSQIKFIGYYYAGSSGTVQLLAWTTKSLFSTNQARLEEFLNGLVVSDNPME